MFLNNNKKNILLIFVCWQNTFLVRNTTPYVTLLLAATATSCLSVNFLLEYSTSPRYIPYILCSKHKSNHRSCVFQYLGSLLLISKYHVVEKSLYQKRIFFYIQTFYCINCMKNATFRCLFCINKWFFFKKDTQVSVI